MLNPSQLYSQICCYQHCIVSKDGPLSVYDCVKRPPTALGEYVYVLKKEPSPISGMQNLDNRTTPSQCLISETNKKQ